MKKKLSFIVPCYNEEKNISLFYSNVLENFKSSKYDIEIVFINDGSKDNTLLELKKLTKFKDFEIKVINFSRNFGKDAGIYAGLQNSTGNYTVLIDADMQQPPSLVLKMLEILEKNDDIDIVAYYQEKRIENKVVSGLKKLFYKTISKISGLNFTDSASDFRNNVKDAILSMSEHNRFSKGIFAWIGFNTYYIPYVPKERIHGKSSFNIKSLFKYAFSGILSFSKRPFKFIFNLGFLMVIISFIWLIVLLILRCEVILQYIFILFIFMFGLNFIILSYISSFINRCYIETLNRPIYISKEVITNKE